MTASDDRTQETNDYRDSQNMMWLWGQFLMIPVAALVYSIEMLLRTMQGMQQVTNQGISVMVGPTAGSNRPSDEKPVVDTQSAEPKISSTNNRNEEETTLNTTDNNNYNYCAPDDTKGKCLILWRYKVLFIKRDLEHAFGEVEDLVPDDVSDITAWKIAEFIQQLAAGKIKVPDKWIEQRYPAPIKKYWKIEHRASEGGLQSDEIDEAVTNRTAIYLTGLP